MSGGHYVLRGTSGPKIECPRIETLYHRRTSVWGTLCPRINCPGGRLVIGQCVCLCADREGGPHSTEGSPHL